MCSDQLFESHIKSADSQPKEEEKKKKRFTEAQLKQHLKLGDVLTFESGRKLRLQKFCSPGTTVKFSNIDDVLETSYYSYDDLALITTKVCTELKGVLNDWLPGAPYPLGTVIDMVEKKKFTPEELKKLKAGDVLRRIAFFSGCTQLREWRIKEVDPVGGVFYCLSELGNGTCWLSLRESPINSALVNGRTLWLPGEPYPEEKKRRRLEKGDKIMTHDRNIRKIANFCKDENGSDFVLFESDALPALIANDFQTFHTHCIGVVLTPKLEEDGVIYVE